MKKLYLLFALWAWSLGGYAQETDSAFRAQAISPFRFISPDSVPGGRLLELTSGAASLAPYYNGQTDSVCTFSRLRQFLREMDHAQLSGNLGQSRAAARSQQARYAGTATVPLALLHFEYGSLKPYAPDSLISYNPADSAFYMLQGAAESPFQTHRLFAMAPLQPGLHTGSVSFVLGSVIGNAPEAITSYSINFGDGAGTRTVLPGQAVAVQYTLGWRKRNHNCLIHARCWRKRPLVPSEWTNYDYCKL